MLHKYKYSRLWAGIAAMAVAGSAMAVSYEKDIPIWRGEIKDPAAGWDSLWGTVLEDITVMGILFAIVCAWLILKYRRRPGVEGGGAHPLTHGGAIAWLLIPTFVFLADDMFVAARGWQLWVDQRTVPAERLEIQLMSGMYSWDYTYPNGVTAQSELKVPVGKPVLLRMTSRDVIHNHYLPDFRIKEDSMPGRITYLWFYPKTVGTHLVTCNEYCGVGHSMMSGQVIVLPTEEYNAWYEAEGAKLKQAAAQASPAAAAPAAQDKPV